MVTVCDSVLLAGGRPLDRRSWRECLRLVEGLVALRHCRYSADRELDLTAV